MLNLNLDPEVSPELILILTLNQPLTKTSQNFAKILNLKLKLTETDKHKTTHTHGLLLVAP